MLALVVVVLVAGAAVTYALTSRGGSGDPAEAVRSYDQVFKGADCDGFTAVTTSEFRTVLGLTSCDKFDANAKDGSIASFRLKVTSSDVDGDTSTVRTRETFTTATGPQSIDLLYSLVKQGGDWKVNGIKRDKAT